MPNGFLRMRRQSSVLYGAVIWVGAARALRTSDLSTWGLHARVVSGGCGRGVGSWGLAGGTSLLPPSFAPVADDDGVDRGLIRRHLAMSPEERLLSLDEYLAFCDSVSLVKRDFDGTDPTHPKVVG